MVLRVLFFLLGFSFIGFSQTSTSLESIRNREKESKKAFLQTQSSIAGANFNVLHYRCEWTIDPNIRAISGRVRTTFRITHDTASFLVFDFYNGLTVDSVKFRGQKRLFAFNGTNLFRIEAGSQLTLGTVDSVSIYYKGVPANTGFGGFNKQTHAGAPILWTMSCPYAARDWWPCIQNLEDKADSIDLIITTPAQYRAAGNGLLVSETQSGTQKTYHWKHRYPIATYLIATAITNYAAYTQKVHLSSQNPGDSLPVVNFVYPEILSSATNNTKKVLPILQFYDSLVAPYPFRKEKYGHAQFGWGGGMEHQTMSFMTDFSFDLQAHELAHQWFGDFITCRSWRDIWLNEGWATYMAALSAKRFGTSNFTSWLTSSQNSVKSSASGSVWVNDTTDINRVFDSRLTYTKGALVLHMLRWELGDAAFWQGVRNYQADANLAYGFSTTHQFIHHLELASERNLSGFMADWFTGQGYPTYALKLTQNGNDMELKMPQTTSHVSVPFFEMKVPVRFRATGFDTTIVFQHDSSQQVFHFTLPFAPTTVTFDPDKWLIAKSTVQIVTESSKLIQDQNRVSVFPNPFHSGFEVKNESGESLEIRIVNVQGDEISKLTILPNQQKKLDLSDKPAGVYFASYEMQGQLFTRKLAKQ